MLVQSLLCYLKLFDRHAAVLIQWVTMQKHEILLKWTVILQYIVCMYEQKNTSSNPLVKFVCSKLNYMLSKQGVQYPYTSADDATNFPLVENWKVLNCSENCNNLICWFGCEHCKQKIRFKSRVETWVDKYFILFFTSNCC